MTHWRTARADNWRALRGAFSTAFGRGRSDAAWQAIYDNSPEGSISSIACTASPTQIVAHYGGTIHSASGGENSAKTVRTILARDVFTSSQTSGLASGRLLLTTAAHFFDQARTSDVALAVGFGSSRHFRLGALRLGYQRLKGLQRLEIKTLRATQPAARHGWLVPVTGHQTDFDRICEERVMKGGALLISRTGRFMAWRFGPELGRGALVFLYRTFTAPHASGYAVIRRSGGRWLLMDVSFPPSLEMIGDFWEQLLAWIDVREGTLIETWCCESAPEYPIWTALGFEQRPFDAEIVPAFRICDARIDSSWVQENLLLSMADCDML